MLTKHADLPHDLLVELAGPALRRLAAMGERILTDPHGDSELAATPRPTLEELAKLAYAAYVEHAGGYNWKHDLPAPAPWDDLLPRVRDHWLAAARAIAGYNTGDQQP